MKETLTFEQAIRMAMEAEQKAAAFYEEAAESTQTMASGPLRELAKFEHQHYAVLVELEQFLRAKGTFADSEGTELTFTAPSEAGFTTKAAHMSMMEIITVALGFEERAEKRYHALADQTDHPDAQALFTRLAQEEKNHYKTLREAYVSLNEHGVWAWSEE